MPRPYIVCRWKVNIIHRFLSTGDYDHWFARSGLSDSEADVIMLAVSLLILCLCLFGIVKILHSFLKGSIAKIVHKYLNADFPGYAAYFTGYLAIIIGAVMTFTVQSSSIT